jgi:hypothetical protein
MKRAVRRELSMMVDGKPKELDEENPEKAGRVYKRVDGGHIRRGCDLDWLEGERNG